MNFAARGATSASFVTTLLSAEAGRQGSRRTVPDRSAPGPADRSGLTRVWLGAAAVLDPQGRVLASVPYDPALIRRRIPAPTSAPRHSGGGSAACRCPVRRRAAGPRVDDDRRPFAPPHGPRVFAVAYPLAAARSDLPAPCGRRSPSTPCSWSTPRGTGAGLRSASATPPPSPPRRRRWPPPSPRDGGKSRWRTGRAPSRVSPVAGTDLAAHLSRDPSAEAVRHRQRRRPVGSPGWRSPSPRCSPSACGPFASFLADRRRLAVPVPGGARARPHRPADRAAQPAAAVRCAIAGAGGRRALRAAVVPVDDRPRQLQGDQRRARPRDRRSRPAGGRRVPARGAARERPVRALGRRRVPGDPRAHPAGRRAPGRRSASATAPPRSTSPDLGIQGVSP